MARFEAALASASAASGVIQASHAKTISQVCERAIFDLDLMAKEARVAGTLAIPFVKALTQQVAAVSPQAARGVHFGATSQDVIDTAASLCMKEASERISSLVVQLGDATASLAKRHAATPTLARTLLQPAAPVPFGWRAAMWLAPFVRSLPRYREAVGEGCVLQFGGAAGTLAAFGEKGPAVAKALGEALKLRSPVTWHSARDGFARLGSETAILAGLAAKVARDVALLMQAELGEAAEPAVPGRGGSSSMPHKRNPAGCLLAIEASMRAPGLAATLLGELAPELERGIGHWQSQWFTLRSLTLAAASALSAMLEVVQGLKIDADAMRVNLERTKGLAYSEAVSLRLSRPLADRLCEQALKDGRGLLEVMRADPEVKKLVPEGELEGLFDADKSFAGARAMIERVLTEWATARESAA